MIKLLKKILKDDFTRILAIDVISILIVLLIVLLVLHFTKGNPNIKLFEIIFSAAILGYSLDFAISPLKIRTDPHFEKYSQSKVRPFLTIWAFLNGLIFTFFDDPLFLGLALIIFLALGGNMFYHFYLGWDESKRTPKEINKLILLVVLRTQILFIILYFYLKFHKMAAH